MSEEDGDRGSLVPSPNRELVSTSNALVRRGLDQAQTPFHFALAVIDSLQFLQAGMIGLREVRDTTSRLQASLTENLSSHTSGQIQQVLSGCLNKGEAAYESISQARKRLRLLFRWEVYDPKRSNVQERAAHDLEHPYNCLESCLLGVVRGPEEIWPAIVEESSLATDDGLLDFLTWLSEVGDEDQAFVDQCFLKIAEILARPELGEHLKITDAEYEQLGRHVLSRFSAYDHKVIGDVIKPGLHLHGWPNPTGRAAELLDSVVIFMFHTVFQKEQDGGGVVNANEDTAS